ncbi:MAG: hypothetical protein HZC43_12125 [Nitrosomonadales bacterium]|nr:hypothetical protein [Nitrosomonadales bacterium]
MKQNFNIANKAADSPHQKAKVSRIFISHQVILKRASDEGVDASRKSFRLSR